MRTINHWINGRAVDREPERVGAVDDPASGEQTARVAYATADDVDAAVQAAKAAFPAWRDAWEERARESSIHNREQSQQYVAKFGGS